MRKSSIYNDTTHPSHQLEWEINYLNTLQASGSALEKKLFNFYDGERPVLFLQNECADRIYLLFELGLLKEKNWKSESLNYVAKLCRAERELTVKNKETNELMSGNWEIISLHNEQAFYIEGETDDDVVRLPEGIKENIKYALRFLLDRK